MDAKLEERLKKWHKQIEKLKEAEQGCLQIEAHEKSLFASLFLKEESGSVVERECKAYASERWVHFKEGLAVAKSNLNNEKRLLELLQSAFQAEYLEAKMEADAIKKWPKTET